ncbi:MAG: DUF6777 domain-containing protein [Actinomycetota bacterium]
MNATAAKIPFWNSRPFRLAISAALLVAAALVLFTGSGSQAGASSDIVLQGADVAGTNVFTPTVAAPAEPSTAATTPPPSSGGLTTAQGSSEGLFAGTRNVPSCNAPQLIAHLQSDQAKAAAWAAAFGLNPAGIKAFVDGLTPVLLRVDTRVTDFGLRDGRAVARQVVLQSGTAVFIERTGVPRIRCTSGNPLGPPRSIQGTPTYTGPRWPAFQPATLVVINPAPTPLTVIILVDLRDGVLFGRIPGSVVIIDIDRPLPGVVLPVVQPGQLSTVTGANWPPGTALQINFDNPAVLLANATAGGDGTFSVQVTIPLGAPPGIHQIIITGGGFTVAQTFYVIPTAVRLL